jgi:cytochrome c oxidase subunit 1
MIFFLVMPGFFGGFANYFLPIFQTSQEVVYPRINNLSLIYLYVSYLLVILSLISEFGGGTGWTLYPPLSTSFMSLSPSSTFHLLFGLLISGISSSLTSINFWMTILNLKSYYLTFSSIPLYYWSILITSIMLLLTLPILSTDLLMVLSDLYSNTLLFDPIFGGDPIFYQHLFWFFAHPEVYILIIPAFGLISLVISSLTSKPIFGFQSMIFAMSSISLLGILIWGHHMYTVDLESDTRAYFTGVTILISLPTATKIFNWLSTYLLSYFLYLLYFPLSFTFIFSFSFHFISFKFMSLLFNGIPILFLFNGLLYYRNSCLILTSISFKCRSLLFSLAFILMFTIGGSTGIILGNAGVDLGLHDTYYIVAHFHFVLSLGAVIAILSGLIFYLYYIFPFLLYNLYSLLSLYHLIIVFIGIVLTFSPMHFIGFNIIPRRIPDCPDSFHSWNFLSSIGSGITLISFAIFS